MIKDKKLIVGTIICLIPMIFGVLNYDKMPELMAIHFDSRFEPDTLVNKNIVIFLMPIAFVLFNIFFVKINESDRKNKEQSPKVKALFGLMIPIICVMCEFLTYGYHLGFKLSVFGTSFMGLMVIIIGNYFPKIRHNYFMGIKLPWTLENEEIWDKTHRFAGFVWVIGGLILIIVGLIKPFSLIYFLVLVILLILPMIYSYILYRRGY